MELARPCNKTMPKFARPLLNTNNRLYYCNQTDSEFARALIHLSRGSHKTETSISPLNLPLFLYFSCQRKLL